MNAEGKKLLIAGGGTGGHIFPAIAIADAWESNGGEVLFVGTPYGLESRLLPQRGKRLEMLRVGQIKGKGAIARLRTLAGLPFALLSAIRIIRNYQPDVVLGMGGYVSAPTVVAARLLGIATALHEQNARAGLTNRLLGKVVDNIYLSFADAAHSFAADPALLAKTDNPHARIFLTGNPVRTALREESPLHTLPSGNRPFNLLVFGGSQGARIFSNLLPPALKIVKESGMPVEIRHQVPQEDLQKVAAHYEQLGIKATLAPFFQNMAEAYRQADLVICRAGATTVAELAAVGKPALFIPYPHAADDHQTANALAMVRAQGGWMQAQQELSVQWLSDFLLARMADPAGLLEAGQRAHTQANPHSAEMIIRHLLALIAPHNPS
ncbi:undecaprenyldiphospho-muramoylpentapeptide beta-N-acetylglucosaminyltransferase [Candidatus Magnetaquicoccus inordinatus]|uniref:undecaprenyldiphospho-muramoylpentapeptide beta-N-acetylglucosaminyltransferase n=1 Tax=Candidatus Magnetaquicoccus inordinatus TaxID=2496818 RepID=UPI00102D23DD|nr:undecaprenyldiphospho-muramoylpentapeptide beta-N-acetylglucosaminyltransferase [Candidatus Magnetaquicoccus inordinatus]